MPTNDTRWVSRDQLISLLGEAGAARVIEVFGGARIWVPRPEYQESSKSFAPLAKKLGVETAQKFCAEFGDIFVEIPQRLFATREQILTLSEQGLRPPAVARKLGCSERYVYTVLASER